MMRKQKYRVYQIQKQKYGNKTLIFLKLKLKCILIMPSLFLAHAETTFNDNLGFCKTILFFFSANYFADIFSRVRLGWVLNCELTASDNIFFNTEPIILLRNFGFFLEPSYRSPVVIQSAYKEQFLALLGCEVFWKKFCEMVVWGRFYNLSK